LIEEGSYYYAFSHIPLHQLRLPKETFTITCFRDPIKRIISHYNMLVHYRDNNIYHSCMKIEGHWLGNSVLDFVERRPKKLDGFEFESSSFNNWGTRFVGSNLVRALVRLDWAMCSNNWEREISQDSLDYYLELCDRG